MEETEKFTSYEELVELVKNADFFGCCVCVALNKGIRDVMNNEDQELSFSIGDYDIEFKKDGMCFVLCHKVYFARIISAHLDGTYFVGDNKEELIQEFLIELEKDKLNVSPKN